jgi:peptide/nickel transport system substrate-binding protein
MAELRVGQLGLATDVPVHRLAELDQAGFQVLERPGVQALYVRLHARKPPLDDVRVRRAIVQAIDVDGLIDALYDGHARRINGPYPPEVFGYDADAPLPTYDPAGAQALLRDAGLAGGFGLSFDLPRGRYPAGEQVAQVVSEQLNRIGIQVELRAAEWGAYLSQVQAGQGGHLFLLAGTNRTFDPHFTITRLYADSSPFGRSYYGNPRIGPLAAEAAGTLDPERRRALYRQILQILRDDAPAIWLAQLADLYGAERRLAWSPRADSLLWMYSARLLG